MIGVNVTSDLFLLKTIKGGTREVRRLPKEKKILIYGLRYIFEIPSHKTSDTRRYIFEESPLPHEDI